MASSPSTDLLLPHSSWEPPRELPDLSRYDMIAVDLETCDPELHTRGPGWVAFGPGHVAGIAYSAWEGPTGYLPIAHGAGTNMDRNKVLDWARREFRRPDQAKVFHNAGYDIGWLKREGVDVRGPIVDTQLLAALLDESRRARKRYYTLDDLGADYLGRRKDESLLRDAARVCGLDPKNELWKLPPPFVGAYAEQDARLTLELYRQLWINCEDQDLELVMELECALIPTTIDMRWRGVRVDVPRAERLLRVGRWLEDLARENVDRAAEGEKLEPLPTLDDLMRAPPAVACNASILKHSVDIWSDPAVAKLPPEATAAVEVAKRVHRAMMWVQTQVLGNLRGDDRVHPNWTQLVDGEYGTITGRYACAGPNLHGAPRRDPLIGNHIRSLFLPEKGERWASLDYSQQEPRLVVHYASLMRLDGAEEAVRYYHEPDADFHQMVADMCGVDREQAKTVNNGLAYGMGVTQLGQTLGLAPEDAGRFFAEYHKRLPYVLHLSRAANRKAQYDGFVRTLLDRRCRFDLWEPRRVWEEKQKNPVTPLPRAEAEKEWRSMPLERAYTYRAMARLIQGSAADQTKAAMRMCALIPGATLLAQIHDELCFSIASQEEELLLQLREGMACAIPLRVPVRVDVKVGDTWGDGKEVTW